MSFQALRNIKKIYAFIFLGLVLLLSVSAKEQTKTKYYKLANGLRVFLYERHVQPVVNIVFGVDLGSKNETAQTSGLVHILEHCILFRGTEFRSGPEISQDARRHGAYFNAHTGQDFALFEMSLPSEYAAFGLKNQREVLFHLELTQEALDEEKQVILEEISRAKDDPFQRAHALVYQNLFPGHPYQKPVYGTREIIESASIAEIDEFYKQYFVPANCALAVVGDFTIPEMEAKIQEIFGELPDEGYRPPEIPRASPLQKTLEVEEEMDINLGYLVIGMTGPDYNHPDQFAMDVLIEIMGSGINPMIFGALGRRRIRPNSVRMGYSAHKFGGAVLGYITLDPKKIQGAKNEILRFFKQARQLNYSKKDYLGESQYYALDYLESAKNQIRFKAHQAQEKGLLVATSLVRFMLMSGDPKRGDYIQNIEAVSSSDIRKAAGDYLGKGRYVIVVLKPKKGK